NPPPSGGNGPCRNWVGEWRATLSPVPPGPGGCNNNPHCDSREPIPATNEGWKSNFATALSINALYFGNSPSCREREASFKAYVVRNVLLRSGGGADVKAAHVSGPTTPSSFKLWSLWKRLTADSVSGP